MLKDFGVASEAQKHRIILAKINWPADFADDAEKTRMKRFLF